MVLAQTKDFHDFINTVTTALNTTDNEWKMTVAYDDDKRWMIWAITLAFMLSLSVTFLLITIMVQKVRYRSMEKKYLDDLANPQKLRLRMYLDAESEGAVPTADMEDHILKARPIADLFPHTTILCTDIVGFTTWSSVRDPSLAFQLLQTLYHSFDKVRVRHNVHADIQS